MELLRSRGLVKVASDSSNILEKPSSLDDEASNLPLSATKTASLGFAGARKAPLVRFGIIVGEEVRVSCCR
jgi:hypothetical protein